MISEYLAIGGFVIALIGVVSGIVVRDRQVHRTIDDKVDRVRAHTDEEVKSLHERINRTRDDMVRQSDLQNHTSRVEGMLSNMQGQLNMLIQRLLKE